MISVHNGFNFFFLNCELYFNPVCLHSSCSIAVPYVQVEPEQSVIDVIWRIPCTPTQTHISSSYSAHLIQRSSSLHRQMVHQNCSNSSNCSSNLRIKPFSYISIPFLSQLQPTFRIRPSQHVLSSTIPIPSSSFLTPLLINQKLFQVLLHFHVFLDNPLRSLFPNQNDDPSEELELEIVPKRLEKFSHIKF